MAHLLSRAKGFFTRKQKYEKMHSKSLAGNVNEHICNQDQGQSTHAIIDGTRSYRRQAFSHDELLKDFKRIQLKIVMENLKKSGLCWLPVFWIAKKQSARGLSVPKFIVFGVRVRARRSKRWSWIWGWQKDLFCCTKPKVHQKDRKFVYLPATQCKRERNITLRICKIVSLRDVRLFFCF